MTGLNIPNQPRILIVGQGAREHAIAWKLAQSPRRPTLFAAPGNPGMRALCECLDVSAGDVEAVVDAAKQHRIDLVVVGPEQPLSLGLVDRLTQNGIRCFGPSQQAAELETSKAFAKALMKDAKVPTASYEVFTDAKAAQEYVKRCGAPIVIKADGLAAGKGVVVAQTVSEAESAIDDMMLEKRFGDAGAKLVVESFLEGTEVSLMFFVDDSAVVPMLPARDHKPVYDADRGPNTGGMGAFAPVSSFLEAGLTEVVESTIVHPALNTLKERGIHYRGVLYAGLMITANGPYVVEFNVRFGDPETEVVLPLLKTDLLEVLWAVSENRLSDVSVQWHDQAAVCVVLAAPGYPENPQTGSEITLSTGESDVVFHAGTASREGRLVTAGGRVLTVLGQAADLSKARGVAYGIVNQIYFDGKHFRTDIGLRTDLKQQ